MAQIEARYGLSVRVEGDPGLISPDFSIDKFKTATRVVPEASATVVSVDSSLMDEIDEDEETQVKDTAPTPEEGEDDKPKKRRRRRRRGRGRSENADDQQETPDTVEEDAPQDDAEVTQEAETSETVEAPEEKPKRKRAPRKKKSDAPETDEAPAAEPESAE